MLTMYEHVPLGELLKLADAHADPLVRELSRRLDACAYELAVHNVFLNPQQPIKDT